MSTSDPLAAPDAGGLALESAEPTPAVDAGSSSTRSSFLRGAGGLALGTLLGATLFGAAETSSALGAAPKLKDPTTRKPTNLIRFQVANTNHMPWQNLHIKQTGANIPFKALFADPDTGMQIFFIRYPVGFTNVWHTHKTAHGFWIEDGTLVTHDKAGRREHPPGTLVWAPEGGWMEHGTLKNNDCTFLFITNKPFDIYYEGDPGIPYPAVK